MNLFWVLALVSGIFGSLNDSYKAETGDPWKFSYIPSYMNSSVYNTVLLGDKIENFIMYGKLCFDSAICINHAIQIMSKVKSFALDYALDSETYVDEAKYFQNFVNTAVSIMEQLMKEIGESNMVQRKDLILISVSKFIKMCNADNLDKLYVDLNEPLNDLIPMMNPLDPRKSRSLYENLLLLETDLARDSSLLMQIKNSLPFSAKVYSSRKYQEWKKETIKCVFNRQFPLKIREQILTTNKPFFNRIVRAETDRPRMLIEEDDDSSFFWPKLANNEKQAEEESNGTPRDQERGDFETKKSVELTEERHFVTLPEVESNIILPPPNILSLEIDAVLPATNSLSLEIEKVDVIENDSIYFDQKNNIDSIALDQSNMTDNKPTDGNGTFPFSIIALSAKTPFDDRFVDTLDAATQNNNENCKSYLEAKKKRKANCHENSVEIKEANVSEELSKPSCPTTLHLSTESKKKKRKKSRGKSVKKQETQSADLTTSLQIHKRRNLIVRSVGNWLRDDSANGMVAISSPVRMRKIIETAAGNIIPDPRFLDKYMQSSVPIYATFQFTKFIAIAPEIMKECIKTYSHLYETKVYKNLEAKNPVYETERLIAAQEFVLMATKISYLVHCEYEHYSQINSLDFFNIFYLLYHRISINVRLLEITAAEIKELKSVHNERTLFFYIFEMASSIFRKLELVDNALIAYSRQVNRSMKNMLSKSLNLGPQNIILASNFYEIIMLEGAKISPKLKIPDIPFYDDISTIRSILLDLYGNDSLYHEPSSLDIFLYNFCFVVQKYVILESKLESKVISPAVRFLVWLFTPRRISSHTIPLIVPILEFILENLFKAGRPLSSQALAQLKFSKSKLIRILATHKICTYAVDENLNNLGSENNLARIAYFFACDLIFLNNALKVLGPHLETKKSSMIKKVGNAFRSANYNELEFLLPKVDKEIYQPKIDPVNINISALANEITPNIGTMSICAYCSMNTTRRNILFIQINYGVFRIVTSTQLDSLCRILHAFDNEDGRFLELDVFNAVSIFADIETCKKDMPGTSYYLVQFCIINSSKTTKDFNFVFEQSYQRIIYPNYMYDHLKSFLEFVGIHRNVLVGVEQSDERYSKIFESRFFKTFGSKKSEEILLSNLLESNSFPTTNISEYNIRDVICGFSELSFSDNLYNAPTIDELHVSEHMANSLKLLMGHIVAPLMNIKLYSANSNPFLISSLLTFYMNAYRTLEIYEKLYADGVKQCKALPFFCRTLFVLEQISFLSKKYDEILTEDADNRVINLIKTVERLLPSHYVQYTKKRIDLLLGLEMNSLDSLIIAGKLLDVCKLHPNKPFHSIVITKSIYVPIYEPHKVPTEHMLFRFFISGSKITDNSKSFLYHSIIRHAKSDLNHCCVLGLELAHFERFITGYLDVMKKDRSKQDFQFLSDRLCKLRSQLELPLANMINDKVLEDFCITVYYAIQHLKVGVRKVEDMFGLEAFLLFHLDHLVAERQLNKKYQETLSAFIRIFVDAEIMYLFSNENFEPQDIDYGMTFKTPVLVDGNLLPDQKDMALEYKRNIVWITKHFIDIGVAKREEITKDVQCYIIGDEIITVRFGNRGYLKENAAVVEKIKRLIEISK